MILQRAVAHYRLRSRVKSKSLWRDGVSGGRCESYGRKIGSGRWERRRGGQTLRSYSALPRCSVLTGVILPKIPSFSSLAPAVKNSSVARPLLVLSPPKLNAHSPPIDSGEPVWSRSVPSNLPVTALN